MSRSIDPRMAAVSRIRVRGIELAISDRDPGAKRGRALVLAHATGFCAAVWEPIARALDGEGRVIAFDQRGHGDSDKPPPPYPWSDFVEDLAGLIDALDLRDVVAIGHSKGGAAVAGVAARFPGRIGRAVLLDPVLVPRLEGQPGTSPLAEGARRRRAVWDSRAQMLASFSGRPPFAAWDAEVLRAYVEHGSFDRPDGRIELKCPPEVEASIYEGGALSASLESLAAIDVPTLLVTGEVSSTLPPARARDALARLRDGRLHVLPGVGHFVPMEAPGAVVNLVRAFLRETDRR